MLMRNYVNYHCLAQGLQFSQRFLDSFWVIHWRWMMVQEIYVVTRSVAVLTHRIKPFLFLWFQFWIFWIEIFELILSPYEDPKLFLSLRQAIQRLILCCANFLKIPNLTLRIFDFLRSKSEIISSPFLWYRTPSAS